MVKKTHLKKIKRIVGEYVQLLERDNVPVERVLLYGSHAKGTPRKNSDIDICVLSKKFGKNPHEEGKYLFRQLWFMEKGSNIEPIGYSPKQFYATRNQSPLVVEIKKHGIIIF